MTNEYIIINKTQILKRIEELEKIGSEQAWGAKIAFKEILSQSTPLQPELEKSFEAGENRQWDISYNEYNPDDTIELTSMDKREYISNLKLDI